MNRFYHGGHLGDLVCALYAIKKFGGGEIYIGPHDRKCCIEAKKVGSLCSCWSESLQHTAVPLCAYQDYIFKAERVEEKPEDLTYDFTKTWSDQKEYQNEKTGIGWHFEYHHSISACQLKKRDLINLFRGRIPLRQILRIMDHNESWLRAPRSKKFDVVVHLPHHKICRDQDEWKVIMRRLHGLGLSVAFIGAGDVEKWGEDECWELIKPWDLLDSADYINSARLFIGVSSCNYHIAEALDQFRFVECRETWGTEPRNERGYKVNHWTPDRLIESTKALLDL